MAEVSPLNIQAVVKMLVVPTPPLERSLDDFYGDSAARVDEFIAVWSRDLPRDLSEINEQIGFVFHRIPDPQPVGTIRGAAQNA